MTWQEIADKYYKGRPLSYGGQVGNADGAYIFRNCFTLRRYEENENFRFNDYAIIPHEEFERLLLAADRPWWKFWK